MKPSKHPRLRAKTYKTAGGKVLTYYVYDMRGTGQKDVRLGTDFAAALEQWNQLHHKIPLTIGRVQEAIDAWRNDEEKGLPSYKSGETRKGYTKQLKNVEAAFGQTAWHEITLPGLQQYLRLRSAKTQGNRELSVLSILWSYARKKGMTGLHWPAEGVKDWKNEENAREFEVTDALFNAVYKAGDQVLRDCMDIATSTGMRLTDARTVKMPVEGKLRFRSGKTGKWAYFEMDQSPVLTALLERRGTADCVMLLCDDKGRQVTESMLRGRYEKARENAAKAHPELAEDILAMYLRDCRKRAADLAEDMESASKLLQHSSVKLTSNHYRTKATKLKAVR